ncbi:MAG: Gfo/Idh/MocA family oxidoreductase [Caldicoprobacterales bacterium]
MSKKPITAIIVGAGHRGILYASYALHYPDQLKIVGVADLNPHKRAKAAEMFGFGEDMCFETAEELAARPKLADAIINGTMDHQHVQTSIPLLERGYDMLLEKPLAVNEEEMWQLVEAARKHNSKVMICHVLRYSPFYADIRRRILDGEIGDIISIQCNEYVSYHHMIMAYVRGKWSNTKISHSSMLLAKSCHDMDLMMWLNSETKPVRLASYGNNFQFTPEKSPENAGTRCLLDCPIEPDCPYSAKKHYLDKELWGVYVWDNLEHLGELTPEKKIESLKTDNPYGRCVWKCDNDVVDHQSVVIEFENGATGTLNMIGGAAKANRTVHIVGTRGEIEGDMLANRVIVRKFNLRPGEDYYSEDVFYPSDESDVGGKFLGHGGGDGRLVEDFIKYLTGEETSISCTSLEDSIYGHLAVYKADESREKGQAVELTLR